MQLCTTPPPPPPPPSLTCQTLASSRLEHAVSVLPMSLVHCFDLSHRNSLIGQMLSVSQHHRHHLRSLRGAMQVAMTSLLCSKAACPMSLHLPPQPAPTDQPPMKWCIPPCLGHTARASLGSALLSLRQAATAECSSPLWVRKWALSWAGMGPISARSDRSVGTAKSAYHCSCFLAAVHTNLVWSTAYHALILILSSLWMLSCVLLLKRKYGQIWHTWSQIQ